MEVSVSKHVMQPPGTQKVLGIAPRTLSVSRVSRSIEELLRGGMVFVGILNPLQDGFS